MVFLWYLQLYLVSMPSKLLQSSYAYGSDNAAADALAA